jgi:hypothetical protein
MNRARQLLRDRLEKRGMANSIGVGMLFWLLSEKATASVVSPALAASTIEAAMALAAGEVVATSGASTLTEKVALSTTSGRKFGILALVLILLLGVGGFVSAAWMYEFAKSPSGSPWQTASPPPSVATTPANVSSNNQKFVVTPVTQPPQNPPGCHK